ncbi:MAG TPA: hypothetical protein VL403_10340, partial [Candidatus Kryptonia bacterium]|nr:hypothetical protein [Candidatus Kryptonia bacterium]
QPSVSVAAGPMHPQPLADAVIAAIAQEIRTPLLALRGYGQLLGERGAFDDTVTAHAARLEGGARAVAAVVDDLVSALRAQSRREAQARVATDFNQLVAGAVQRANERARSECKRIELHRAPLLPVVVVDRVRFAKLLDRLLSLAIAAVPTGKGLTVATGVQRRRIVLRLESKHAVGSETIGEANRLESSAISALARVIVGAHGGDVTLQGLPGAALGVTMRLPIGETRWAVGQ